MRRGPSHVREGSSLMRMAHAAYAWHTHRVNCCSARQAPHPSSLVIVSRKVNVLLAQTLLWLSLSPPVRATCRCMGCGGCM